MSSSPCRSRICCFIFSQHGCFLTGYEELTAEIKKHLAIEYGQTTADGRFTLLPICCLGNCDKGPTLMIDNDTHGPVRVADVPALLERDV